MIHIKTEKELEKMRVAGRLTAIARKAAADAVKPGVTTWEIDRIVRKTIEDAGAKPSFLGYGGFPGSACVSLNDQVIHGIPSKHAVVKEGDIVKVDVGAYIGGFHGDCACTVPCGEVSEEAKKLIAVTRQSFFEGIKFAREGYRVSDIGAAVQAYVEANGFSVVRDYVGHGVGAALHESPEVPNYGKPGHGIRLQRGMVIAVEPMVNVGVYTVKVLPDGWTVKTQGRQAVRSLRKHHRYYGWRAGDSYEYRRRSAVMAEIRTADIVLSLTGRDRGQLMLVVAEEGDFLLLANGRARRAENPKRKRRKHVSLQGPCDERTRLKLQSESRLTNSEIRKALALWTGDENAN